MVNFVEVQRRVGEGLLLEGAGTPFHQNRRRTTGNVELRAQRETKHYKVQKRTDRIAASDIPSRDLEVVFRPAHATASEQAR